MVPLDTWGSLRDLSNAGVRLTEGTVLVIHDASDEEEDLEGRAVAYYDPERAWWYAELQQGFEYVPARDRTPVTVFLCLGCRTDTGWPHGGGAIIQLDRVETCPTCGLSSASALAPP